MTPKLPDQRPAIAAAVIVRDGRVLLVRRRQKEGTLLWAFPAGEVETGETAHQAAAREVGEEVGLMVVPVSTLGERIHPATGRRMIYVSCDILEGSASVVDEDELVELTWADHDQVAGLIPTGIYPPVQDHLDVTLRNHVSSTGATTDKS